MKHKILTLQYLDYSDKVYCDSFVKVTVGGVESQNLHDLSDKLDASIE